MLKQYIKDTWVELALTIALIIGTGVMLTGVFIGATDEVEKAPTVEQAEVVKVQEPTPIEPIDTVTRADIEADIQAIIEQHEPIEFQEKGMLAEDITLRDLYELVALIILEAGDQSDKCQRAVASVVVNRVNSDYYPNTLHGVITQHGQYEPVIKGKTNYYINVMENGEAISDEEFEEVERALENVLFILYNGNTLPSDDYLFQAQFEQGIDTIPIGTEIFGRRVK